MVEAILLRGNPQQRRMASLLGEQSAAARIQRRAAVPRGGGLAAAAPKRSKPSRETYDAQHKDELPGVLVRKAAGGPVADRAVNEAHDGAGATYELYRAVYGRDSLDGRGMKLVSSVHFDVAFNNAFWNGEQMVYGDGDGRIFLPLTRSLSVIGHELSHGVVQYSGGLAYQDQAGALNESFADVFGVLTVQYKKKQKAADARWLVGDGILGPNIEGEALRSLKAPGTAYRDRLLGEDPQPFHMSDYVNTSADNGGVHINSGIPNHAFYLLARFLGGFAWEKAGHIWYDALQRISNPHASFVQWADETVEAARQRFGAGSLEQIFTRRAWKLVGIAL
jgi:Zn-dependent metalloprotease